MEVAPNVSGEYDLLDLTNDVVIHVLSETSLTAMKVQGDVHGEVTYQNSFSLETVLPATNERETEHEGTSQQRPKDPHQSPQCWREDEGEVRALVLLSSLSRSFESLITGLLIEKSTIRWMKLLLYFFRRRFSDRRTELQVQVVIRLWW